MADAAAAKILDGLGLDAARAEGDPVPGRGFFVDLPIAELAEHALARKEGEFASNGAFVVETGEFTGRSPNDRFVVDTPDVHDKIAWGAVNRPIDTGAYEALHADVLAYLNERDIFVVRGMAGADRNHSRKFMVACERASQALFIKQMLVRPRAREMARFGEPDFTVLAAPGFVCDPARHKTNSAAGVVINFAERMIIVAGTGYSGEIKKSIFSVMNYLLPIEDDVLPMHCSASMDPVTHETAVFFGLSGTGKTTLSANPTRLLIGDDEHGWSDMGIFNVEGGCYAKCEGLDFFHEPEIYNAVRFGAICENVVLNDDRTPDYNDTSLTRNTRVAYPVEHIPNAWTKGMGGVPSVVLFLTCDAFGVLPPISRLTPEAAMYHFVTGFTAKVAGTEQGIKEPVPTFSALFGEPFMPLDPLHYAEMLRERIERDHARVYLVNTGWTGGGYGVGHRMKLSATRAMVRAALSGQLDEQPFTHDDRFGVDVPLSCPDVDAALLDARGTWADPQAYDKAADHLASMFQKNFAARYPHAPEAVREAGPRPQSADDSEGDVEVAEPMCDVNSTAGVRLASPAV